MQFCDDLWPFASLCRPAIDVEGALHRTQTFGGMDCRVAYTGPYRAPSSGR